MVCQSARQEKLGSKDGFLYQRKQYFVLLRIQHGFPRLLVMRAAGAARRSR